MTEKILLYEPTLKFEQTTFRFHCGSIFIVANMFMEEFESKALEAAWEQNEKEERKKKKKKDKKKKEKEQKEEEKTKKKK